MDPLPLIGWLMGEDNEDMVWTRYLTQKGVTWTVAGSEEKCDLCQKWKYGFWR